MRRFLYLLPVIVPLASRWVKSQEASILSEGDALTAAQIGDARQAGVAQPERIRVLVVDSVPLPGHVLLRRIIERSGALTGEVAGMSLRYGIHVARSFRDNRELLVHEFVHTAQYERIGSVDAFLKIYIRQCLELGYAGAPMEHEAIETASRVISMTAR